MSETYCKIIFHDQNVNTISTVSSFFSEAVSDLNKSEFGSYVVDNCTVFENTIIAEIVGSASLNVDAIALNFSRKNPDWLYFRSEDTQVGGVETLCIKKDGKKTTKKTLLSSIRKLSKSVDIYYGTLNEETEFLEKMLLECDEFPDILIEGIPLLSYIVLKNKLRLLKLAIKKGANIDVKVEKTQWFGAAGIGIKLIEGMNLLSVAIVLEATNIIPFLINIGIDVNAIDSLGDTPINVASETRSCHKFMKVLVDSGADINHYSNYGFTPAMVLLKNSHYDSPNQLLKILDSWVDLGADVISTFENGATSLWYARTHWRWHSEDVEEYLKSKGVELYKAPDNYYDDSLSLQVKVERSIEANDIQAFDHFFDFNCFDKEFVAEKLHEFVEDGSFFFIKSMLSKGVPPYLMRDVSGHKYYAHELVRRNNRNKDSILYLKEKMMDFNLEAKQRKKIAHPLYNRFMSICKKIDIKYENSSDIIGRKEMDLSLLEEFSDHLLY